MRTFIAIIFAICVLSTSVSAGSLESCKIVLDAIKEQLPTFYKAGKQMKDLNAMTPEYQKQFDGSAYQIAQYVYDGCDGLTTDEINTLAQSIYTAPADCKKYAGMFTESMVEGVKNKESQEGCWDGLYQFSEICNA